MDTPENIRLERRLVRDVRARGRTIKSIKDQYNSTVLPMHDKYVEPSKIFSEISKLKPGQGREIHITDAIKNLVYKGEKFFGNIFMGKYLDCGTIGGYIQSSIKIFKGQK